MISKIIIFCLVYLLSIVNFVVILSPLTFLILTKFLLIGEQQNYYLKSIILLVISFTTFLMFFLFAFDFLFALTVNKYSRSLKEYSKIKELIFLKDLFENVKKKFNCHNIKLLIEGSDTINAYAVGGLRKNIIVLTTGILNDFKNKISDIDQFKLAIEGVIAHEMSHIINKDYFSGLFLIINEKALNFISKFIFLFFNIFIKIFSLIPFFGQYFSWGLRKIYGIFNYLIYFIYSKIILKLYRFIQLQVSKQIEYRSDNQAALLVGGEYMANALSCLGPSGFFSIFSSHPRTQSRVKKVKSINKTTKEYIRSVFGTNIYFLFSFFIVLFISYKTFILSDHEQLINNFQFMYSQIIGKINYLKTKFNL